MTKISYARVRTGCERFTLSVFSILAILAVFSAPLALAVEPTAPVTPLGTQDQVLQIINTNGSAGTGTVFDKQIVNGHFLEFCIVTADHVLSGGGLASLGFRSANASFAGGFDTNAFNFTPVSSVIHLGSAGVAVGGGGQDTPDIAFLGVTIDLNNVGGNPPSGPTFNDATKALLLNAIAPTPLGTFTDSTFPTFSLTGYGRSGVAPTAAELAANPLLAGSTYISHFGGAANEQYGIERSMSDSVAVNEFARAQNGTLLAPYHYHVGLNWFQNGNSSYAMPGDSGAGLVVGGKIQAVFNADIQRLYDPVLKQFVAPPSQAGDFLVTRPGDLQTAVGLTQDYTNFLETNCGNYMQGVPEPSSVVLAFIAALALVPYGWSRRNAKRRAA